MAEKIKILDGVRNRVTGSGLTVVSEDLNRPWGGFFVLDETEIEKFARIYFPGRDLDLESGPCSPKVLVVGPGEELSWQYHHRRAEIWQVIDGPVAVKTSETDAQPRAARVLTTGDLISFDAETRHRLIGVEAMWGVVAEIWQHTDPNNLSSEADIVRLEDRYSRS